MYVYSTHRTREQAQSAIEEYYALGEVFPCEFAKIRQRMNSVGTIYYDVMLWA